ncbi:MAG: 4-hydroxy-tetrahydrodipicolinate reductase [Candidatus Zixiibacteriota bacterium]|nr:MAG: 4-hydroxy-tetrahydrodipicolinate reductase [candidate division Zixibacteria bacterium]
MALSANKQTVIPIALCGAAGRMGREIFRAAAMSPEICIVRAYEAPGHRSLGARVGEVSIEPDDVPTFLDDCRVMVDFSAPLAAVLPHLEKAAARGVAAVVGSTGLEPAQRDRMEKLAGRIPILYAANMSLGVNLLIVLAQRAQELLGKAGFDVDVVETHHRGKKDAPSGTALMIEHHLRLVDPEVDVRHHSLRAGDVVGEHTVQFTGAGERLELTHRAGSREAFARGVMAAVHFLAGKTPGMYDMRKVLGL